MPDSKDVGGYYINQTLLFGGVYGLKPQTPIFVVPLNDEDADDDKNYSVRNTSYFGGHRSYPSSGDRMEFYNMTAERKADAVVYYSNVASPGNKIQGATAPMIVTKIADAIDDEQTVTKLINGYVNGAAASVTVSSRYDINKKIIKPDGGVVTSTVNVGDIIRYGTDSDGKLNDYQKLFSLRDEDDPSYMLNDLGYRYMLAYSSGIHSENKYKNALFEHHKTDNEATFNSPNTVYFYGSEFRSAIGFVEEIVGGTLVLAIPTTPSWDDKDWYLYRKEIFDVNAFRYYVLDENSGSVAISDKGELSAARNVGFDAADMVVVIIHSGLPSVCAIVKRK
jgi:hypothetical protein